MEVFNVQADSRRAQIQKLSMGNLTGYGARWTGVLEGSQNLVIWQGTVVHGDFVVMVLATIMPEKERQFLNTVATC